MTSNDIPLYPHQMEAVGKMKNGCILCGGVGTGKSRTSLYYYWKRICQRGPVPLYVITTARKRDTRDWEQEAEPFVGLAEHMTVDSWNNIAKYVNVKNAFFIFDEQRVVGYGKWSKSFITISRSNLWILLTATPGDTWMDYIPVFIANGFYRNKTDFINQHVVYSRATKFPKVSRYLLTGKLMRERNDILIRMDFKKKTVPHDEVIWTDYDIPLYKEIAKNRWDVFKGEPIADAGGLCYCLRRAVNSSEARMLQMELLIFQHPKAIVFYNFNYELDLLREMAKRIDIPCAEWNGLKHQPLPEGGRWIYLVQYTAGAEGWNCTTTDTVIFFSQNYSYKIMTQAAGRIDRLNTPFTDLYYYHLCSHSSIDLAIRKAIREKRTFNESIFASCF